MRRVVYEDHGAFGVAYLDRAEKRNAIDVQMVEDLSLCLDDVERRPNLRVLVIAGRGSHFCAGADLHERASESVALWHEHHRLLERVFARLRALQPVLIATVRGWALGGGCELALTSDLVFADTTARFGLPEVRIGLIPGCGGTQLIMRKLPRQLAAYMLLTGDSISAGQALRYGLVARVARPEKLEGMVQGVVERLLANSPRSLEALKSLIAEASENPLGDAFGREIDTWHAVVERPDYREGLRAFVEGRPPAFSPQEGTADP